MLNFDHDREGSDDGVIVARGLRKRFAGSRGSEAVEAVQGVDLNVSRGEIFGFLGPNGAGKTTTLRMLTTLLPIDDGSAIVAGIDIARHPGRVRERIGYVSQLGGADELASGRENLILQGRLYGGEPDAVRARAEQLLDLLDLRAFADRRVGTYSGGQRRRLDVALGIVHDPSVLFLDEPSTGLDPQNRANLWDHVRALRDRGSTVFLTTHYLEEADALCDRLAIIDHGQIIASGPPAELKRQVGGDTILLDLRKPADAINAQGLLDGRPGVHELAVDEARLRLLVSDGGVVLPELLRTLDQDGIAPRAVSLSEPTLDDVFLRHTGRSLRDSDSTAQRTEPATAVA
jgi:ABC-2 type transport system ATP-binding protein